ncbi:hypothetical protein STEG23_037440, partial [Scotinomys teguina]
HTSDGSIDGSLECSYFLAVINNIAMYSCTQTLCDVIHTVGPIARGHINGSHKEDLANCYQSSLKLVKENNLRSV